MTITMSSASPRNLQIKNVRRRFFFVLACMGFLLSAVVQPASAEPMKKIISLAPSITETVVELNAEEQLVGVTEFSDHLKTVSHLPRVGGMTNTNYEKILSLEPDLVLVKSSKEHAQTKKLRKMGIDVEVFRQETVDEILTSIDRIGELLQKSNRADKLISEINKRMDQLRKKTRKLETPGVIAVVNREYGSGTVAKPHLAGKQTFLNEMIELAGGKNLYEGPPSYGQVSTEFLLSSSPDYVLDFVPDRADYELSKKELRSDWYTLDLFSQNQHPERHTVLILDQPHALLPGPRFIDVAFHIAKLLHPDVDWKRDS